jgi:hypothetical protein
MRRDDIAARRNASLTPDGIFVLHLRSDSDTGHEHLVGRVEHVKSGESEPFSSLGALLGFIHRHSQNSAAIAAPADREG